MKVLELFGGIGAPRKALERITEDFMVVDYVEIDKYAVKSYNAIFNENYEPQDICEWDKDIEIDLIVGGFPCQDISIAGKQKGIVEGETRSGLMYEMIRIIGKAKPKYVIAENVKNILSKKHRPQFDVYLKELEELGYTNYYQVLNAKDYGIPQNRERVFVVSILDENPMVNGSLQANASKRNDGICPALTSAMGIGGGHVPIIIPQPYIFPKKQELKLRLKDMLEEVVDEKYYLSDEKVQKIINSNFNQEGKMIQEKDICDTLLARDYKDPKAVKVESKILTIGNYSPSNHEASRIVDSNGIAPTVKENHGTITATNINYRTRKLTPLECWKLMGFDDEDFYKAEKVNSNSQLYKQAGNSIVVNVLEEIFKVLLKRK